jgi:hypothetical protein
MSPQTRRRAAKAAGRGPLVLELTRAEWRVLHRLALGAWGDGWGDIVIREFGEATAKTARRAIAKLGCALGQTPRGRTPDVWCRLTEQEASEVASACEGAAESLWHDHEGESAQRLADVAARLRLASGVEEVRC